MKIEKDFKVGGQRNWMQVLCNGGVGAFLALCHLIECGVGEKPIDFENYYVASWMGKLEVLIFLIVIYKQNNILARHCCDGCVCLLQWRYVGF